MRVRLKGINSGASVSLTAAIGLTSGPGRAAHRCVATWYPGIYGKHTTMPPRPRLHRRTESSESVARLSAKQRLFANAPSAPAKTTSAKSRSLKKISPTFRYQRSLIVGTRGVFMAWRDRLAARSRRQADYAWVVLARVLVVGCQPRSDRRQSMRAGRAAISRNKSREDMDR